MSSAADKVLIDEPAPQVARLRINRPDKRNAIDHDVRQQLTEALQKLLADGRTRALVIGGVGGHLSAGGDIPSMVGLSEAEARARMQHIAVLCTLVGNAKLPVVTAMEGIAAGACVGLALLGDHIVVGENTKILFPFLKLGLAPDWGSLLTLPRRVGLPAARRILTSGDTLTGREALAIGLVDELAEDVMAAAIAKASQLAALPQAAFARMKQRLNAPAHSLAAELQREEDDQAVLLLGADFKEGYAAFTEKRAADFIAPKSQRP